VRGYQFDRKRHHSAHPNHWVTAMDKNRIENWQSRVEQRLLRLMYSLDGSFQIFPELIDCPIQASGRLMIVM
jgi:hypothetical protein